MKISTLLTLLLVSRSEAFTTTPLPSRSNHHVVNSASCTALESSKSYLTHNNQVKTAAAALILSWTLVVSPMMVMADSSTLDFSLPSKYDYGMQGFGEGKEAILNTQGSMDRTDPGANEKEKQMESMRQAEEARQAAKSKKKEAQKAAEEEAKQRAAEKKARDAERLKNIWN